ncbi:hypothetical protein FA95DRAFT_1330628 [Auriscalpium vulgare]|uniref:Uncharacterized protein n=1 Tax=Auriscalpium vulgare TaxID=40419 RepID=A0ACB8S8K7_9AGAM|nr:hypothetical protein FA95DRAFT_1330628 [Auriscalpium vulgare]
MGGGDLNMKKSWHPLLMKNQERVWLEEKKALEEKKKLDQLRKEKEEERQLQELQRLQEEQTGKKKSEKLEWMYSTPATGSTQNTNDLEDYLLGKKRVDKILKGDENEKVGAAHKNFIAVQNANNIRDVAAKVREDPLFAIKQQEAAAYEALMSNPLRLREMQERNGMKPKKDKKDKKREKKEKKEKRRERRDRSPTLPSDYDDHDRSYSRRSPSPYDRRARSPPRHSPSRSRYPDDYPRRRDEHASHPERSRDRSPDDRYRHEPRRSYEKSSRRTEDVRPRWPRSDESDSPPERSTRRGRSRSVGDDRSRDDHHAKRDRSSSPRDFDDSHRKRPRVSPPPRSRPEPRSRAPNPPPPVDDRAARLAAMTSNASAMTDERKERLTALLEKEKAELEREEQLRAKSKGMGGFLSQEQKKVFGGAGGLEDRLKRGRAGLVSQGD